MFHHGTPRQGKLFRWCSMTTTLVAMHYHDHLAYYNVSTVWQSVSVALIGSARASSRCQKKARGKYDVNSKVDGLQRRGLRLHKKAYDKDFSALDGSTLKTQWVSLCTINMHSLAMTSITCLVLLVQPQNVCKWSSSSMTRHSAKHQRWGSSSCLISSSSTPNSPFLG